MTTTETRRPARLNRTTSGGSGPPAAIPPDLFVRIAGRIDTDLLQRMKVAIIGVGSVGSHLAVALARSGVGALVLVDGKRLDAGHVVRHILGADDVGENKAFALRALLERQTPWVEVEHVPRHLTTRLTNAALDHLLDGCDLVIAATDDLRVQQRVNRRALARDVPAVFPGVDEAANRGEVFVSLGQHRTPCFRCWTNWRDADNRVRGAIALGTDMAPTIDLTIRLSLGLLDPASPYARLYAPTGNGRPPGPPRPRTLFMVSEPGSADLDGQISGTRGLFPDWLSDCPDCGGSPAQRRGPTARRPRRAVAPQPARRSTPPATAPDAPDSDGDPWLVVFAVVLALVIAKALGMDIQP